MSRSLYYLNPFEMIYGYADQIQEWRKEYEIRREQEKISDTRRESQRILSKIDEMIKQTHLKELPPATLIVDLDSSEEAARKISSIGDKIKQAETIFKPDEIPLSKIMDEYIPTFKVDSRNLSQEIIDLVGREITFATRGKLRELGFKAVDESARIFRGVIRVEQEGKYTDILNLIGIGPDGLIYIIHPDKHPRNLCDAAARRLRAELSKPIEDNLHRKLKKYYSEKGVSVPQKEKERSKTGIHLQRETPG